MFLDKTLSSHSASLHLGFNLMGNGKFNARGLPYNGLASHPGGRRNTPSNFMLLK